MKLSDGIDDYTIDYTPYVHMHMHVCLPPHHLSMSGRCLPLWPSRGLHATAHAPLCITLQVAFDPFPQYEMGEEEQDAYDVEELLGRFNKSWLHSKDCYIMLPMGWQVDSLIWVMPASLHDNHASSFEFYAWSRRGIAVCAAATGRRLRPNETCTRQLVGAVRLRAYLKSASCSTALLLQVWASPS